MGSSHCPQFNVRFSCRDKYIVLCHDKNLQSIVVLSWAGQPQGQALPKGGQTR